MVTLIQNISYCSFGKCSYKYYLKCSNFKLENVACKPCRTRRELIYSKVHSSKVLSKSPENNIFMKCTRPLLRDCVLNSRQLTNVGGYKRTETYVGNFCPLRAAPMKYNLYLTLSALISICWVLLSSCRHINPHLLEKYRQIRSAWKSIKCSNNLAADTTRPQG